MNKVLTGLILILVIAAGGFFLFRSQSRLEQKEDSGVAEFTPRSDPGFPRMTGEASSAALADPSKECSGKQIISLTEGPYYKAGSPEKSDLYQPGIPGTKITLTGYVLDTNCKPVAGAWIDFWQADGAGTYDNSGYKLRGHQFTDANGRYTLVTVVPGEYPGRTAHIHVKVKAGDNTPIITTQVFVPGTAANESDSIYDQSLLMQNVQDVPGGKTANFNFVI